MKNKRPYNSQDQRHGTWECYYSNGQLSYKGNYINGKQDGAWEHYYSNGQLHYKGNYTNGKEDGIWFESWNNDKHSLYLNI